MSRGKTISKRMSSMMDACKTVLLQCGYLEGRQPVYLHLAGSTAGGPVRDDTNPLFCTLIVDKHLQLPGAAAGPAVRADAAALHAPPARAGRLRRQPLPRHVRPGQPPSSGLSAFAHSLKCCCVARWEPHPITHRVHATRRDGMPTDISRRRKQRR